MIVHMIRTEKIPFIRSRAAVPVLLLTSGIMGAEDLVHPAIPRVALAEL